MPQAVHIASAAAHTFATTLSEALTGSVTIPMEAVARRHAQTRQVQPFKVIPANQEWFWFSLVLKIKKTISGFLFLPAVTIASLLLAARVA